MTMSATKLYESYEWIVPFELSSQKGKKVIIRGVAIHAAVSKNLRKYVRQELIEFGRTLAEKYIDVNHEYSLWELRKSQYDKGESLVSPGPKPKLKGHVIDSQYNHLNGFVEYVAEINHPEYAQKLIDRENLTDEEYFAKWKKQPIRCVSIDANYRFARTENGMLKPHGIIGRGLSLVEDPKVPGVEGSSVEVVRIQETQDTAQFLFLQNLFNEQNIATEVMMVNDIPTLQEKGYLPDVEDLVTEKPQPIVTETQRIIESLNIFSSNMKRPSTLRITPSQRMIEEVIGSASTGLRLSSTSLEPEKG
jgi:hypothetical protein